MDNYLETWISRGMAEAQGQSVTWWRIAQEAYFEHFWPDAENLAKIGPSRLIFSISDQRPRT